MWNYHPDLLQVPVPRYTSYPTAADFGEVDPSVFTQALDRTRGDVSLYVHIPFCEKICFYCGCNTAAAGKRSRLESYLAALHREIELVGQRLPRATRVGRIAFGGGSPNAITPGEFSDLVDALARHFRLDHPVSSIEIDPRTMTREWADAISQAGIERASLGVQTFAPHCQSAIGRVQSEDTIMRTVDWLRDAGVSSLNFDLMYGLPGQSPEDLIDSLHRTRVLGADRIALFGYAHVPHLVPRQRAINGDALPGQEERFAMAASGYAYLCTHGYMPVGFDHFAKPGGDPLARATSAGLLRRNFQGFTDDPSDVLIGLGSSAISSFPDLLIQNEKNSGRYRMMLSQGQLPGSHGIVRSEADQIRGDLIERLLCQGHAHIPVQILQDVKGSLAPFTERGLASIADDHLTICPDGLPYARTIAALFDTYRVKSVRRFSAAV